MVGTHFSKLLGSAEVCAEASDLLYSGLSGREVSKRVQKTHGKTQLKPCFSFHEDMVEYLIQYGLIYAEMLAAHSSLGKTCGAGLGYY